MPSSWKLHGAFDALAAWTQSAASKASLRAWTPPALLCVAASGVCVFASTALSLRGICSSTSDAAAVTAKIGLSVARTLGRLVFARRGGQRFPNWTLRFEVTVAVLRLLGEHFGARVSDPRIAKRLRRRIDMAATIGNQVGCGWMLGASVESVEFIGLEHIWIRPRVDSTDARHAQQSGGGRRCVLLLFHGGGFVLGSPRAYIDFGSRLLKAIKSATRGRAPRVDLLLANYRKAPEHPYPAGPDDAYAMYRYLVDHEGLHPSQIIVAGDSAGASLALTTLTTIRDVTPEAQPLAGVLLCPFIDLDPANVPENHEAPHCILAREEVLGSLAAYAGGDAIHSGLDDGADLRGLPPMLVLTGTLDLLREHALQLVSRARQQSLEEHQWELDCHMNMPHDFLLFPAWVLPHSTVGITHAAAFIARHVASQGTRRG